MNPDATTFRTTDTTDWWSNSRTALINSNLNIANQTDICQENKLEKCDVKIKDSAFPIGASFPAWVGGYVQKSAFQYEVGEYLMN